MAKQAVGIGVLFPQIFADIGMEDRRVAQHLLPVVILQPGIVVGHGDAVQGKRVRPARRRDRRRERFFARGFCQLSSRSGRGGEAGVPQVISVRISELLGPAVIARSHGSRECAPDDKLRDEAIQGSMCGPWIASLRSQ